MINKALKKFSYLCSLQMLTLAIALFFISNAKASLVENNSIDTVLFEKTEFLIANMFGWLRPNGRRRFKYVDIAVPRKNAKSTLAGAIGNFMLYADGEGAPQIYSAATKLDQAKYVFNAAAAQVRSHEILNKESNVFSSVNNN